MADVTLPRETTEHLPIPVYADDILTTAFEVCLTRWPARPSGWRAADVDPDGEAGIAVAGLTPGTYQVWVRVNGAVVSAGIVEVT
jgi:hypothetical protein